MKKIIYIIAIMLSMGMFSCKKFLEEKNIGGITNETIYKDAEGYEKLVYSCYSSMRDIYEVDPKLFEWGTDVSTRGEIEPVSGSLGDRLVRATQLNEYKTLSPDNSGVSDFFSGLYAGIQRCNTAINTSNKIPDLAEAIKGKRTAEVRFIRAYFYYLLVENFGGIPIVKDEINTPVTHFVPASEKEVYDFIIDDLNFAANTLDPVNADYGRVTKGAAKHLLSLIYLTRGYKSFAEATDFGKSAQLAEEVIGGNYSLLPSFADVFKSNNQKNNEIIFSIQFDPASLKRQGAELIGNGQNIVLGWRIFREQGFFDGETAMYNRRASDFMPTQFLYTLYNTTKDSRYDATFLSQFYAVKDGTSPSPVKKGDLRFYFPKPDQPFTNADELELKAANPNVVVIRFDQWKQDFDGIGGALKFPMVNKFFDPLAATAGSNERLYRSTRDIYLFRLAETYLIAAEAYFKMGQPDKAAEKLNKVRERAQLAGQSLTITAADVNIDFILDERAREFVGEYKRWLDLKRTHRLDRAFEHNILTKMANPSGVIEKYYLRPIPQSVIDRDTGGYPQNKDY